MASFYLRIPFKKPVSRAWERAPFSQRRYSFWYYCPGLELQWQNGIWIKKQNSPGFSRLLERGMQVVRPWLPFVLGRVRIWLALKYTQWMLIDSAKCRNQGTYYQGDWVNLTSCQSLHSSSKSGCFRNKFVWLVSPKEETLSPATPTLSAWQEIASVDAGSAPPCFLIPVCKVVFPFEDLSKYLVVVYVFVPALKTGKWDLCLCSVFEYLFYILMLIWK